MTRRSLAAVLPFLSRRDAPACDAPGRRRRHEPCNPFVFGPAADLSSSTEPVRRKRWARGNAGEIPGSSMRAASLVNMGERSRPHGWGCGRSNAALPGGVRARPLQERALRGARPGPERTRQKRGSCFTLLQAVARGWFGWRAWYVVLARFPAPRPPRRLYRHQQSLAPQSGEAGAPIAADLPRSSDPCPRAECEDQADKATVR